MASKRAFKKYVGESCYDCGRGIGPAEQYRNTNQVRILVTAFYNRLKYGTDSRPLSKKGLGRTLRGVCNNPSTNPGHGIKDNRVEE